MVLAEYKIGYIESSVYRRIKLNKKYKYNKFYLIAFLVIIVICFFGAFGFGKSRGFLITSSIICILSWFAVVVFKTKIVIDDECIFVDIGKMGKRIERNWYKIDRVSRVFYGFLWMYTIHCEDQPNLTFSNGIANYQDLLKEIISRAPNAKVDDSIKKLLEKKQDK